MTLLFLLLPFRFCWFHIAFADHLNQYNIEFAAVIWDSRQQTKCLFELEENTVSNNREKKTINFSYKRDVRAITSSIRALITRRWIAVIDYNHIAPLFGWSTVQFVALLPLILSLHLFVLSWIKSKISHLYDYICRFRNRRKRERQRVRGVNVILWNQIININQVLWV